MNEEELSSLERQYPGLQWTCAAGDSSRFYTGKHRGIQVVSISQPSGDFFIYQRAAEIIKGLEKLDGDEKFVLDNYAMMYNLSERSKTLKKICMTAEKALKRYYILQKKEEIYAESNYKD